MQASSLTVNVKVKVLFFAKARELSGLNEATLQLDASNNPTVADILERICTTYNLQSIKSNLILAINESYCNDLTDRLELQEGVEIAVIPPITFHLLHWMLPAILALITNDACGAISVFLGTTRDNFEGKRVLQLEYEPYESLALKELQSICVALRARWTDVVNIAICHRLGIVAVKEVSVVITVSAPHRQAARWLLFHLLAKN